MKSPRVFTDVCLAPNFPFITLTESKVPNVWYHEERDELFVLSKCGFSLTKGSKKALKRNKLLNDSTTWKHDK
jgi:hypothetical protein